MSIKDGFESHIPDLYCKKVVISINKYEIKDDYIIGYTIKNNEYYIDKEDFDKVKKYNWKLHNRGMITKNQDGKYIFLHQLIMGPGIWVHKNGNKKDNRKNNLFSAKGYKNNGKSILNGYIAIYMPEHPRAFKNNGCVYEHILIAERKLKRKLSDKEVVHHIDFNRQNNNSDNLMIFATESDHVAYHNGAKAIQLLNGAYKCENDNKIKYHYNNMTINDEMKIDVIIYSSKELCPICGDRLKWKTAQMCKECRNKIQAKNIPPKEELELLIYNTSFEEIGRKYHVSGKTIVKWCKKYNLPYRKKDMKQDNIAL